MWSSGSSSTTLSLPGKKYLWILRIIFVSKACGAYSTKDNVAPFSFVMPVSIEPPMLAFACYTEHDTYRNIVKGKEFVVNVMPPEFAEKCLYAGRGRA